MELDGSSGRRSEMLRPEAIAQFRLISRIPDVTPGVLERLAAADEKLELEPALATVIGDPDETPHGPTEIADILTVHLTVLDRPVLAAVAIKGKAWPNVKEKDVTYQLTRAAQVPGLTLLVLAAVGNIQDDVKRDLAWLAEKVPCDWMILDRSDLARLFVAYGRLCPNDATWLSGKPCAKCNYSYPRHSKQFPSAIQSSLRRTLATRRRSVLVRTCLSRRA